MDGSLAGEVLDCLSSDRRIFRYFKHRYALILLALAAGRRRSVAELRRTPLAGLLSKPIVEPLARKAEISSGSLEAIWPPAFESYVVTLAVWGDPVHGVRRWDQITRRGVNLVLQLNFSAAHDRAYRRLLQLTDDDEHPFEWSFHPVNDSGRRTLAWVRLDIDLNTGEALIEEVQSDWIREAMWAYAELRRARDRHGTCRNHWLFQGTTRRFADVERYFTYVLEAHRRIWDEAALSAAIELLVREVGIRQIYYHTWEGGRLLKGNPREHPPRSLYEKLPRRFCFQRVRRAPNFLRCEPGHRFRRRLRHVAERHGFWFLQL